MISSQTSRKLESTITFATNVKTNSQTANLFDFFSNDYSVTSYKGFVIFKAVIGRYAAGTTNNPGTTTFTIDTTTYGTERRIGKIDNEDLWPKVPVTLTGFSSTNSFPFPEYDSKNPLIYPCNALYIRIFPTGLIATNSLYSGIGSTSMSPTTAGSWRAITKDVTSEFNGFWPMK